MRKCKAWGCTNNELKNKGKHYFKMFKPGNVERRDFAQHAITTYIGTGYTLKTFPFVSEIDKVNKVNGTTCSSIDIITTGIIPDSDTPNQCLCVFY